MLTIPTEAIHYSEPKLNHKARSLKLVLTSLFSFCCSFFVATYQPRDDFSDRMLCSF